MYYGVRNKQVIIFDFEHPSALGTAPSELQFNLIPYAVVV